MQKDCLIFCTSIFILEFMPLIKSNFMHAFSSTFFSIKSVRTGISYQFLLDVFHCKLNCSEDKPCIKKCCDFDESLNSNFTCESDKSQKSTTSLLLRLGRGSDNLNELLSDNHPRLIVNSINFLSTCEPIDLKLTSEIKLLRNGNVQVRYDASSLVELGDYCVDIYKDKPIASYCAKDLLPFIVCNNFVNENCGHQS